MSFTAVLPAFLLAQAEGEEEEEEGEEEGSLIEIAEEADLIQADRVIEEEEVVRPRRRKKEENGAVQELAKVLLAMRLDNYGPGMTAGQEQNAGEWEVNSLAHGLWKPALREWEMGVQLLLPGGWGLNFSETGLRTCVLMRTAAPCFHLLLLQQCIHLVLTVNLPILQPNHHIRWVQFQRVYRLWPFRGALARNSNLEKQEAGNQMLLLDFWKNASHVGQIKHVISVLGAFMDIIFSSTNEPMNNTLRL